MQTNPVRENPFRLRDDEFGARPLTCNDSILSLSLSLSLFQPFFFGLYIESQNAKLQIKSAEIRDFQ
jgi:hypothetical protein